MRAGRCALSSRTGRGPSASVESRRAHVRVRAETAIAIYMLEHSSIYESLRYPTDHFAWNGSNNSGLTRTAIWNFNALERPTDFANASQYLTVRERLCLGLGDLDRGDDDRLHAASARVEQHRVGKRSEAR